MGEMIRIAVVCIKDTFGITEFIVSHPTYFCKYIFSEKIKKNVEEPYEMAQSICIFQEGTVK